MSRKNRQKIQKKLSVPRIFLNVLITVLQIAVFIKIAIIGRDWLRRVFQIRKLRQHNTDDVTVHKQHL
jgi:hypothetical protein